MRIVSSSLCEVGKVRKINQDAIFSHCTDRWGIFAVADGMGGYEEGERASREAVNAVRVWTDQVEDPEQLETQDIVRLLKQVLSDCNDKIKRETPEGMRCGCTVVIMVLVRKECILLTLGDSRCYELQGGLFGRKLVQLTVDDVVGGSGPQRNRLTNALGVRTPMSCMSRVLPFTGRHTYLICSDGIYKYCDAEQITMALKKARRNDPAEVLSELKEQVEAGGAGDNYSAFLIRAGN